MSETRRPRLAIISSWNDSCGNASYTYVLKKEFEKHYDVEVLGLDLYLLKQTGRIFRRRARRHILEMAAKLRQFDYVNIQFEAGLYGATIYDIWRNVRALMDAAPNLILTMHRIDTENNSLLKDIVLSFVTFSVRPLRQRRSLYNYAWLYKKMILHVRKLTRHKNAWIKVHTKREKRIVQDFFEFEGVMDAPLAFLDAQERARVHNDVRPDAMRARYNLPPDAKIIGAFGYIANYKGFEDLIRALRLLPDNWYLLVVGSQHPQSIKPWTSVDAYLAKLLLEIETPLARQFDLLPRDLRGRLQIDARLSSLPAVVPDGPSLTDRVRFVGNVDDDEFTFMLRNSDAVVLPYLEVGQSMSGVIALAIESGARLFCSNNLSFAEARRYYGDVFSRFDMGNYIEIAQRIIYDDSDYSARREEAFAKYSITTLVDLQRRMFEGKVH